MVPTVLAVSEGNTDDPTPNQGNFDATILGDGDHRVGGTAHPGPPGLGRVLPPRQLCSCFRADQSLRPRAPGALCQQATSASRARVENPISDVVALRAGRLSSEWNPRTTYAACDPMKGIGKPCDGKRHARFDEGAMEKCQSAAREHGAVKLPTEADRPELLRSAPRQTRHRPTLLEGESLV